MKQSKKPTIIEDSDSECSPLEDLIKKNQSSHKNINGKKKKVEFQEEQSPISEKGRKVSIEGKQYQKKVGKMLGKQQVEKVNESKFAISGQESQQVLPLKLQKFFQNKKLEEESEEEQIMKKIQNNAKIATKQFKELQKKQVIIKELVKEAKLKDKVVLVKKKPSKALIKEVLKKQRMKRMQPKLEESEQEYIQKKQQPPKKTRKKVQKVSSSEEESQQSKPETSKRKSSEEILIKKLIKKKNIVQQQQPSEQAVQVQNHPQQISHKKVQQNNREVNIETPTLFLGGISYNSTPNSIKAFFSSVGEVQSARVVTDSQTGKSRGFGYVEFSDINTAFKAFHQLNGCELDGRRIRIDSALQRDKNNNAKRYQGSSEGFRGNKEGNFSENLNRKKGGNLTNKSPYSSVVNLSQDDKNAKNGSIGQFKGKKIIL